LRENGLTPDATVFLSGVPAAEAGNNGE